MEAVNEGNFLEPNDDDDELDLETIQLQDLYQILVGNELRFATDLLKDHNAGISIRVMRKNSHNCIGTCDYNPNRVNVAIEGGVIKSIIGIG